MRLFVYSDLTPAARVHLLRHLPPTIQPTFRTDLPTEEQAAAFQITDLLFGNPPLAWFATLPPRLQFWQIDSAGIQQYQGLTPSFPVANVGDLFAWPCAETMLAGLLALGRRIPELAGLQAEKRWVGAPVRTRTRLLRGQRVVILGAGAIGQAVRQQLSGFKCQIQFLARTDPQAQLHSPAELRVVLPNTDIVINCLPGSAEGFFTADLIQAMRPGSLYASVGRGNTTDEPALVAALQAGHLAGAVLDVTAREPLPPDNPLWALPNVLLTQHTGGGFPAEDEGKADVFLRNLGHLQNGEPLANLVNLARGY